MVLILLLSCSIWGQSFGICNLGSVESSLLDQTRKHVTHCALQKSTAQYLQLWSMLSHKIMKIFLKTKRFCKQNSFVTTLDFIQLWNYIRSNHFYVFRECKKKKTFFFYKNVFHIALHLYIVFGQRKQATVKLVTFEYAWYQKTKFVTSRIQNILGSQIQRLVLKYV